MSLKVYTRVRIISSRTAFKPSRYQGRNEMENDACVNMTAMYDTWSMAAKAALRRADKMGDTVLNRALVEARIKEGK